MSGDQLPHGVGPGRWGAHGPIAGAQWQTAEDQRLPCGAQQFAAALCGAALRRVTPWAPQRVTPPVVRGPTKQWTNAISVSLDMIVG